MNKKRALVTGSSRGIGKAIAVALAKDGYHVLVHCAGNLAKAEETKATIEQNGGTAEIFKADLCNTAETAALAERVGDIDILVLNASLQYREKWEDISLDRCAQQLNCNFVSSLLLIQAAVPHMKACKSGRIITIGSVQEAKPHPDMLVYSASKAAQTNMVRSLGNEFVKMIFVSFLNSNIYPLKNLLTSRVCISLETPYSKASSHFPIASHLQ